MANMTLIANSFIPVYTSIIAGYDNTVPQYACGDVATTEIWFLDNYTFANAVEIWLNNDGTGVPPSGYYSNGTIVRFWEDGVFTENIGCIASTSISLQVGNSLVESCGEVAGTFYIASGQTFATMTALYTDEYLVDLAPAGWYSNGVSSRYWNGVSVMGTVSTCITSTQLNLANGVDAETACTSEVPSVYWIDDNYTFVTAPMFYTDEFLITQVPNGFYSNGFFSREMNGVLQPQVTCEVIPPVEFQALPEIGISLVDGDTACTSYGTSGITYYILPLPVVFEDAEFIWTDETLTTLAPAGWLSYDGVYKYWNGSVFTVGPTACSVPPVGYGLLMGYSSTPGDSASACAGANTATRFMNIDDFLTCTTIWLDVNMTIPCPAGEYADIGNYHRYWNGTAFSAGGDPAGFC